MRKEADFTSGAQPEVTETDDVGWPPEFRVLSTASPQRIKGMAKIQEESLLQGSQAVSDTLRFLSTHTAKR